MVWRKGPLNIGYYFSAVLHFVRGSIQLLTHLFYKNTQLEHKMSIILWGLQVTSEFNENNGLTVYLLELACSGL